MISKKNIILQSLSGRPFLADVCYVADGKPKPIVILTHGFMGFKDWGPYDLVAVAFAQAGFVFIKHNLSHDGTTVDHPTDFVDTEAFGNNNFSKELDDLGVVIDWACSDAFPADKSEVDRDKIYLIGHSRGGGIIILKAGEDKRVKKISPWASVNEFAKFWKRDEMDKIKADGVIYVNNSRTMQRLPVYWQTYEDYLAHPERLYIPAVIKRLTIPMLIVHGTDDETVPYSSATEMKEWKPDAELLTIEGGNHVFGAKHPWAEDRLPDGMKQVVDKTIEFFKKQ
jgi:pimeloyl-ACP methyl ester carboxylesterase